MRSTRRTFTTLALASVATLAGGSMALASPAPMADNAKEPQAVTVNDDEPQGIVGGTQSTYAYPWMAFLSISTSQGTFACGGSQISPDIILTAAHCVDSPVRQVNVRIGSLNKYSGGTERVATQLRAGQGPKYGDWAVLKLTQPYYNNSYMVLPSNTSLDAGPTFRAMGWGTMSSGGSSPTMLREVDLPFIAPGQGDCRYGNAEICAGNLQYGGIDTCQGDSGGPLVNRDSAGRWVQVGIVSWGQGCASRGYPGHYAKVTTYKSNILSAISQLGGTQPGDGGPGPGPGPDPEQPGGNVLSNGQSVTVSGARGSEQFYEVRIPAGARNLRIETSGGTGDLDLFVKYGSRPTDYSYDCRPYRYGNNEACTATTPTPGTHYIRLKGFNAFSGATLRATWQ